MENYSNYNAANVLEKVNGYIEELETRKSYCSRPSLKIDRVYKDLSIFDWWKEELSLSNLKDMKKFLQKAIAAGFTGYVSFKVGVSGCANGMWAHKQETTDGYSPEGDFLYKSFSPAYNYWSVKIGESMFPPREKFDVATSIRKLKELLKENKIVLGG